MPIAAESVALIVALTSLVVSIAAWRRARQPREAVSDAASRALDAEPEVSRPTPRKAHINVAVVGVGRNHEVVVSNLGPGTARHVTVSLEPREEARLSPLVHADCDEKLPIPELGPGEQLSLLAALSSGTGTEFDMRALWINEDGSRESLAGVLAAP
jgi:hypothetical protein